MLTVLLCFLCAAAGFGLACLVAAAKLADQQSQSFASQLRATREVLDFLDELIDRRAESDMSIAHDAGRRAAVEHLKHHRHSAVAGVRRLMDDFFRGID